MPASGAITTELKKLFQQSACYLSALAGSLAIGFISFPIFTRVFSVADYGIIDFLQKVIILLAAASKMGLQNAVLRFYNGPGFAADPESERRYYSTMFLGIVAIAGAASVIFALGMSVFRHWMSVAALSGLTIIVAALIFLKVVESILLGFLRIEEKTKQFAICTICIRAGTVVAVCCLLATRGPSARTFFAGGGIVQLTALAILTGLLMRRKLVRLRNFDFTLLRGGLAFGLPLVLYEVAWIVLDSGDRVLVGYFLGADALGRYSVAYGLSNYTNDLLITPLNLALLPIYMRLWRTDGAAKTKQFLSVGLDLFLMVAVGILVLAMTSARDAVTLLASSKYAGIHVLIPLITGGLLIYTTHVFFAAGLLIHKNTWIMAKCLVYSAAVNLVLNCALLPRIGLQAAAISTFVSYLVCVALLARASFRVLPLHFDPRVLVRYAIAGVAAWCLGSLVSFPQVVVSLIARTLAVVAVYGGTLYVTDQRVRSFITDLIGSLRSRAAVGRAAKACEPVTAREAG
jgi:O-antigen/teichoic acid export membrane protein